MRAMSPFSWAAALLAYTRARAIAITKRRRFSDHDITRSGNRNTIAEYIKRKLTELSGKRYLHLNGAFDLFIALQCFNELWLSIIRLIVALLLKRNPRSHVVTTRHKMVLVDTTACDEHTPEQYAIAEIGHYGSGRICLSIW